MHPEMSDKDVASSGLTSRMILRSGHDLLVSNSVISRLSVDDSSNLIMSVSAVDDWYFCRDSLSKSGKSGCKQYNGIAVKFPNCHFNFFLNAGFQAIRISQLGIRHCMNAMYSRQTLRGHVLHRKIFVERFCTLSKRNQGDSISKLQRLTNGGLRHSSNGY